MITREQLSSGIRSLNLEAQSWGNSVPNLWKIELVTYPLVAGTATYLLDASVNLVLDAYATLTASGQPNVDRILVSISRTEYASYATKSQQGAPSVYWFERDIVPKVTLYLTPDGTSDTQFSLYVMKRVQDMAITSGQTPDVPIRFLDALISRVAARLAVKFAPEKLAMLQPIAEKAFQDAITEDHERAQLTIAPILTGYFYP